MDRLISILKGVHPGFVVDRELKRRKIPKGRFAITLQEFPQTLGSITKGKRKMNTALALKIEKELNLEEGFLMLLQVYYDIEQEKRKLNINSPDHSKFRPALFWDTKLELIDWVKNKNAVIKRVFERGNEEEKNEIIRFYGQSDINKIIGILNE